MRTGSARETVSLLWLAGCAGPQALVAPAPVDTELRFEDPNNYRWAASLTVATTEVTAGADFTIDWSALTVDLERRPFDGSITEVSLFEWRGAPEDLEAQLMSDQPTTPDSAVFFVRASGLTLSAMQLTTGSGSQNFQPERLLEHGDRLVVMLYDTDETRTVFDLRGLHYVTPLSTSANVQVDLVDGGSTLTATPDLHSATPLQATAGAAPGRLDWSALTLDAHDRPFVSDQADELIVARVDVATAADVEPLVAALEAHAAESYRLRWVHDEDHPAPTAVDLGAAVDETGAPFAGFTSDGVWLVGLQCDHCLAPMALTVVEVN